METVPAPASECPEAVAAPGAECCPDDAEEHGWYNDPVISPCSEVIIPYAQIHSTESQEAANLEAETLAYQELDVPVPSWNSLLPGGTISITTDIYGALGPEEFRMGSGCEEYCDNLAFCDGPSGEGVTMVDLTDRYSTRWQAKLEDGRIYYRREGELWIQVPTELIPQPNLNLSGLGFCFDANARPCFSSQIGTDVHIWRWQADTPKEYTFLGSGAKLYFTGVLQPDNTLWDVICYFCKDGDLCISFQRENFSVTHTIFSSPSYEFTGIYLVDRGANGSSEKLHIGVRRSCVVFRTHSYPPWPVSSKDAISSNIAPTSGIYFRTLVALPSSSDSLGSTIGPISGEYRGTMVYLPVAEDTISSSIAPIDGEYRATLIQLGTTSDAISGTIAPQTGSYRFVLIQAGAYSDNATSTIAPLTGTYTHV